MSVIGADKTEELDTGSFIDTISDIHAAYLQENGNQTTDLSMKESFSKFLAQGLPGKKDEYWKYTDLGRAISKKSFNLQSPKSLLCADNGESIEEGVVQNASKEDVVVSLKEGSDGNSLLDLSRSLSDCAVINHEISENGRYVLTHNTYENSLNSPRVVLKVKNGVEATLIEELDCPDNSWLNSFVTIEVEANGKLTHYVKSKQETGSVLTSHINVGVQEDGLYRAFWLNKGGKIGRNSVSIRLKGRRAESHLTALNLLKNNNHQDSTFYVRHDAEDTHSTQTVKNIAADKGRVVFQGKTFVEKDAQKTDARQLCKSVLLSRTAEIDAKPELEIYADDVQCAHGATCGELDEQSLFYLRSRGLNDNQARALLLRAFIEDVIENISDENILNAYEANLDSFLADINSDAG